MDYMTFEEAKKEALKYSVEDVWAMLMEDRRRMHEQFARYDAAREVEQKQREAERATQLAEQKKQDAKYKAETDRRMKKLDEQLGRLGISYGDQIEAMFTNLPLKFNALGLDFYTEAQNKRFRKNKQIVAEVDSFLENGEYVMAVEIKTKLSIDDVKGHLERIEKVRELMYERSDSRKILGAVAGGIVKENVQVYAQSQGLYVLKQNGDAVDIVALPEGFVAREW